MSVYMSVWEVNGRKCEILRQSIPNRMNGRIGCMNGCMRERTTERVRERVSIG